MNLVNHGVGSGATDFDGYDSYIKEVLKDQAIWRCLYEGYMGVNWKETSVECDDDWYFVTKVVVHCLVNNESPKSAYSVADRIVESDLEMGLTLKDLQRRGQKVLEEAEKLYWKAKNGTEEYREATVELQKDGNLNLSNFPSGTTYEKNGNIVKIKIPKQNIKDDINGTIYVTNAKVKTCPAFYAEAERDDYQDYVIAADPYEKTSTKTNLKINSDTANLKIIKTDEKTEEKLPNIKFNIRYENGENIGDFITDKNGTIFIENLKPRKSDYNRTRNR